MSTIIRLNNAVNNDKLPYLYGTLFDVVKQDETVTDSMSRIGFMFNKPTKVKAIGNGYLSSTFEGLGDESSRVKELTIPVSSTRTYVYVSNDNFQLLVTDKNSLTQIACTSGTGSKGTLVKVDIEELKHVQGLTYIVLSFSGRGNGHFGNITGDAAYLDTVETINCSYSNIGVDLSVIGKAPNIKNFSFYRSAANITGSVEEFVAEQVNLGRTSPNSSIAVSGILGYAAFGGKIHIPNTTANEFLTWNGVNKIIVYHGASTPAACTSIYAKGATSSEISAWEAAGKTVVVVTDDGE